VKDHGEDSGNKVGKLNAGRLVPRQFRKNAGMAFSLFHEPVEYFLFPPGYGRYDRNLYLLNNAKPCGSEPARDEAITSNIFVDCKIAIASRLAPTVDLQ
jgi:hypothetical protein